MGVVFLEKLDTVGEFKRTEMQVWCGDRQMLSVWKPRVGGI